MSALGAFNTQLIRFFEDLKESYPEERDIRMALEAIQGAKKINPKLILDLFWENVARDLADPISRQDEEVVVAYAKQKIQGKYNEMSPALSIFDKHWPAMSDVNREAIWKYMKVLCVLCENARSTKLAF